MHDCDEQLHLHIILCSSNIWNFIYSLFLTLFINFVDWNSAHGQSEVPDESFIGKWPPQLLKNGEFMVLSYLLWKANLPFKALRGNSFFMLLESKKTGEITVIGQLRYIKILTCLRGLANKTKKIIIHLSTSLRFLLS